MQLSPREQKKLYTMISYQQPTDDDYEQFIKDSYVMGIDSIKNELTNDGFIIENDGSNYMVSFPKEKTPSWEDFITKNLEVNYWNEYIADISATGKCF